MHGIAPGEHLARDHHHVANLERANLRFIYRSNERFFVAGNFESLACRHSLLGLLFIAIKPAFYFAGLRIEHYAESTKGPAVIGDGNEEARRKPIESADLAADERNA